MRSKGRFRQSTRRVQQKNNNRIYKSVKGICLGCYEYKRLAPDKPGKPGQCWDCNHPEVVA